MRCPGDVAQGLCQIAHAFPMAAGANPDEYPSVITGPARAPRPGDLSKPARKNRLPGQARLGRTNAFVRLFLQVLLQECGRSLPGELGRRFVVAAAFVAKEAVLRVGIDVDLTIAAALLLDRLDVAHRN